MEHATPVPCRGHAKTASVDGTILLPQDKVDTIRRQCIGVSAHQKLELLTSLVRLCGYESVAVFGDCFDEVWPLVVFLHS